MTDVLKEQNGAVLQLILNRVHKHNAFDDAFLLELTDAIQAAEVDSNVHVVVLKANGRHFSAGADLEWMQRMAQLSFEENLKDAKILANLMYCLHHASKPTIAMVQGQAIGGGAGLVAACDIAIAADTAQFCFSEVTLGLIPAVISPYIIKALGARMANALFITAERFDAKKAHELHLVHHCVLEEKLLSFTLTLAENIAKWPLGAVKASKSLVQQVMGLPINAELSELTANLIAKQRVSKEGQAGLKAFLNKRQHV